MNYTHKTVRDTVKKFDGMFHGPKVEHVSMTEDNFFKMIDHLVGEFNIQKFPVDMSDNKELAKLVEGSTAAVEATSCEYMSIWERVTTTSKLTWESDGMGLLCTIGKLGDRPVCVSIRSAVVDGKKIIFYHATSIVVDHDMVRNWIDLVMSNPKHSDATNFWNVLR